MMFEHCVVFYIGLFIATGKAQVDYSYEGETGPDRWAELYPECGGERQSPVDVALRQTQKRRPPPLWLRHSAAIPWQATLTNNGHTAVVELDALQPITVRGGPLRSPYVFHQLHFHWGANDSVGSEHAVDSHFAAMEMHMVFYKEEYGGPPVAANHSDGFAVLTTFLDLNNVGNPLLPPIVWALQRVPNTGDVTTLDTRLVLQSLLPIRRDQYFTYQGSLTTPPCDEAVTWIIFSQHVPVSSNQVAAFRTLRAEDGSLLAMNRRPLQPLGDRSITWVRSGPHKTRRH